MPVPNDLRYTRDHEWLRVDGDEGTVGITEYAQDELGDVVFVQLPSAGTTVSAGAAFGEIESVKTVSELFAPVNGEVLAVNDALTEHPELVNDSPYEEGWMIRIRLSDPSQLDALLDAEAYTATLPSGR
jgi:glycine cleavage system H protein